MKKETVVAGVIGFAAGVIAGKEMAKKEKDEQKDDFYVKEEQGKSLMDEIVDAVEKDLKNEQGEKQDKPTIYKKHKNTLKMSNKKK